jgi:hypothetical protein
MYDDDDETLQFALTHIVQMIGDPVDQSNDSKVVTRECPIN